MQTVSLGDNLHEVKVYLNILKKNKKIINSLSSAEIVQRVVMVKQVSCRHYLNQSGSLAVLNQINYVYLPAVFAMIFASFFGCDWCFFSDKRGHICTIVLLNVVSEIQKYCLFVCVEVLWPSQPNGVMSSAVSYLTTRLLGRLIL